MPTVAPPSPLPEFVYKIAPETPPSPIPDAYPLSDLDRQDGFVHLSASWQVPITADLFFKDTPSFWIIKLRLSNFPSDAVKWDEVEGTNGCPHLYGNFGHQDVVSIKAFHRPEGQSWSQVLQGETAWLE
ncbi:hypothetical protein B0T19DRAFT_441505 [Cercophora scortea]|uniref:DUF952 domain-containing protein n=1 Tax=Cercophora scortea TaxID=314031 RepID=A0AAE0IM06_9PEZI|nr:hypothetical protein B0T19DRAFT_441505 [Cercophora scortea]